MYSEKNHNSNLRTHNPHTQNPEAQMELFLQECLTGFNIGTLCFFECLGFQEEFHNSSAIIILMSC